MPKTGAAGWSYLKFRRRALDWATVGVAAVVEGNGSIERARIGLTNMGQTPLRASATEQALAGASQDGVAAAARAGRRGDGPARRHLGERRLPPPSRARPHRSRRGGGARRGRAAVR